MSRLHSFGLLSGEQLLASPSRADGVPENMESRRRRLAAAHMKDVSLAFKMSVSTWAIAVTFFNRFYARKSMKKNNTFIIACASLFLAGKVENQPREHHRLANEMLKAWFGKDNPQLLALAAKKQAAAAAATRRPGGAPPAPPPPDFFADMYATVLEAERALLYTVGFDFNVDIIHTHMARLLNRPRMRALQLKENVYFQQQLVGIANDVYSKDGTLVLQYPLEKIALAAFYFIFKAAKAAKAGKMMSLPQPAPGAGGAPWYVDEGLTTRECVEITTRFTDKIYRQLAAAPAGGERQARGGAAPAPSAGGAASTALLGACESAAYSGGGPTLGTGGGGRSEGGELTSVPRPLSSDPGSGSLAASRRAVDGPVGSPAAGGSATAASEAAAAPPAKRARVERPAVAACSEATSAAMQPPPSRLPPAPAAPWDQPSHGGTPALAASSATAAPAAVPAAEPPSKTPVSATAADSDREEGELEEGELQ